MIKLSEFLGGNMSKKDNDINDVSSYLKELEDKISETKGKKSGASNMSPDEMRLLKAVQSAQKSYENLDDSRKTPSRRNNSAGNSKNKSGRKSFDKSGKGKLKKAQKEKKRSPKNTGGFKDKLIFLFTKENENYNPKAGKFIEKNGKKIKNKKRLISPFKTIRNIVVMGLAFVLLFSVYAGVVIATSPKIKPENIYDEISQSSVIYDDKGEEYDYFSSSEKRTLIDYKEIPKNTINAFVALEDKTFWKHHGLNYKRLIGATLGAFRHGSISGTSTITQQLARNVYLPNTKSQRSIKRKILEIHYAKKIERHLSKEKIVEAYLNSIYFGFGNYGIERAAHTYFNKDVKDLTLEESAALAALPQAPDAYAFLKNFDGTSYDPKTSSVITVGSTNYLCNDISVNRRDLCLDLMLKQGYIDEKQHKAATGKPLKDFINPNLDSQDANSDYFKEYLESSIAEDLIKKYKMDEAEAYKLIRTGGLKVYSTIDKQAQQVVESEFANNRNFPTVFTSKKDSSGNILNDGGSIILFALSNFINDSGDFVLNSDEYKKNDDGSITILQGHRLNIYEVSVKDGKDYSLEFKPTYTKNDSGFYICPGGYINIPSEYKSLDKEGNLKISKKFFKEHKDMFDISSGTPTIHKTGYQLQEMIIQPQSAMVISEVGTGKIKAMVGGRNIKGSHSYNRAINPRQPGSSIKPLAIYGAAIQQSFELHEKGQKFKAKDFGNDKQGSKYYGDYLTEASTIIDEPIVIDGKVWPKNADFRYRGKLTMKQGIEISNNVVAVKLFEQIGADYSMKMAEKFGLKHLVTSGAHSDKVPAGLALGGLTKGATPLEMAEAYATFPAGGVRHSSIAYTKVLDNNGKEILSKKSNSTKVLDEGVAYIMTDMLKSVVTRGIAGSAAISGQSVGGKTGTTSDNFDLWFCGFTAKYAASLWVGSDVNIYLNGSSYATAGLWSKILRKIDGALGGTYKKMPNNVVREGSDYFIKGTVMKPAETEEELKKKAEEEQKRLEEEARLKAEEEARKREEEENNNNNEEGNNEENGDPNANPGENNPGGNNNGRPREGN